jgi:CheY-like chemotaxis protein
MASRVLVAEDEPLIALAPADPFEAEGHAATLAFDGAEALQAARRIGVGALDVLVTDLSRHARPGRRGPDPRAPPRPAEAARRVAVAPARPPRLASPAGEPWRTASVLKQRHRFPGQRSSRP